MSEASVHAQFCVSTYTELQFNRYVWAEEKCFFSEHNQQGFAGEYSHYSGVFHGTFTLSYVINVKTVTFYIEIFSVTTIWTGNRGLHSTEIKVKLMWWIDS